MLIDPQTLVGLPLILKRVTLEDYSVRVADRVVGRIMLKPMAGGVSTWWWTITWPYMGDAPSSGDAETLEQAKTDIKVRFTAWLESAVRQGEAHWLGGPERVRRNLLTLC